MKKKTKILIMLTIVLIIMLFVGILIIEKHINEFDGYKSSDIYGAIHYFERGRLKHTGDEVDSPDEVIINIDLEKKYITTQDDKYKIIYYDTDLLVTDLGPATTTFINSKKYPSSDKEDFNSQKNIIYNKFYNKDILKNQNGYYIREYPQVDGIISSGDDYNKEIEQIKFLEDGTYEYKDLFLKDGKLQVNFIKKGTYEVYSLKQKYKELEEYGYLEKVIEIKEETEDFSKPIVITDENDYDSYYSSEFGIYSKYKYQEEAYKYNE